MGKKHFFLLFLLLMIGVLVSFVYASSAKTSEKEICIDCNVILISIDTLRKNNLGVYGYDRDTSPNLDEYSKDALVFDNFYSTSSWTIPAHSSMLASDFPNSLRMQVVTDRLSDETITLAEVFNNLGYETVGWSSKTFLSSRWNIIQDFNEFNNFPVGKNGRDAEITFPEASRWIKENKNKKFFAFIHTFQVHDPFCPSEDFDIFRGDYDGEQNCIDINYISRNNRTKDTLSDEDKDRYVSLYDAEILSTDYQLGKLFDLIEEIGLDKKTIVIITSDHGEEFGERVYWGTHAYSLYNELVNVPFIIKGPNINRGREARNFSTIDIAPTILDLIGAEKPSSFKGRSIFSSGEVPVYFESSSTQRKIVENMNKAYEGLSKIMPSVRTDDSVMIEKEGVVVGDWKLIVDNVSGVDKLYRLSEDPSEKNNLAKEYPKKIVELKNLLQNY